MIRHSQRFDAAAIEFGRQWILSAIQGIIIFVFLGFLFPLLDWTMVFVGLLLFGIVAVAVTAKLGLRVVMLIALGVFCLSATSVLNLMLTPGIKYVVPVDQPGDAFFGRSDDGPRGKFSVIPTYSLVPIKLWLLQGIATFRSDFVFLDARQVGDRFIAQSPSELAAAAIDRKPRNASGLISFPTKKEYRQLGVTFKAERQGDVLMNAGYGSMGPAFMSNIGPNSPGLFGITSSKQFTRDEWRSLAWSEELLRSLPSIPLPRLYDNLAIEAQRTGSWNDLLRELDFRLAMMDRRYSDLTSIPQYDAYELAGVGNLRYVAEALNARAPDKSLYGNPWLEDIMIRLLRTIDQLPKKNMTVVDAKGSRELNWLVDTLKKLSDLYQDNSLVSDLNTSDDKDAVTDKAVDDLFIDMASDKSDKAKLDNMAATFKALAAEKKPVPTGESANVAALRAKGAALTTDEVLAWIRKGKTDRAWRVRQIIEITIDGEKWVSQFAALMQSGNRTHDLMAMVSETNRAYAFYETTFTRALPLIEDADQRRLLVAELDITASALKGIKSLTDDAATCGRPDQKPICSDDDDDDGKAFFQVFSPLMSGPLRSTIDRLRKSPDGPLESLLTSETLGKPYSDEEFSYMLVLSRIAFDFTFDRDQIAESCEQTANRANDLLIEDRLPERASVIALQAALLKRCGNPQADKLTQAMTERQMPLPSWFAIFTGVMTPLPPPKTRGADPGGAGAKPS